MKQQRKVFATQVQDAAAEERLRSLLSITEKELHDRINSNYPRTSVPQSAALLRQVERLRKRSRITSEKDLQAEAFEQFGVTNQYCAGIVPCLDDSILNNARDFIREALERYTTANSGSIQESLDLGLLFSLWKYGPGASSGTRFTHFADKIRIEQPTVTRRARPLATLLRKLNPHLWAFDGLKSCEFTEVRGSTLSSVPKNEETERTIATEPLMNMALELSSGMYIEGALRCVGIDIKDQQEKNKLLAELGSINDSLATIDLKSASDLISIALIKLLWPPEWFYLLSTIRSEEVRINGDWVRLNMMSTMGNGFTFPMMTLTLLSLVYAVQSARLHRRFYVDYTTTAVFGDDIIVPTVDYDALVKTLGDAGLIVNTDKSYAAGPFRESCGGDFWNGENITPFYIESLCDDPDIYVAINKIHDWCGWVGIYLPKTISYLLRMVEHEPFLVPRWSNPTEGILSSSVSGRYKRWVPDRRSRTLDLLSIHASLAVLIAIGGFVTSTSGSRVCFTPRSKKMRYILDRARMPRGFLDGHNHVLRDCGIDSWLDSLLDWELATLREERRSCAN